MSGTSQPLDHPWTRSTVEGNFQTNEGIADRILDPVRATALHEAVEHCPYHPDATEDDIIRIAKVFEQYLAGDDG